MSYNQNTAESELDNNRLFIAPPILSSAQGTQDHPIELTESSGDSQKADYNERQSISAANDGGTATNLARIQVPDEMARLWFQPVFKVEESTDESEEEGPMVKKINEEDIIAARSIRTNGGYQYLLQPSLCWYVTSQVCKDAQTTWHKTTEKIHMTLPALSPNIQETMHEHFAFIVAVGNSHVDPLHHDDHAWENARFEKTNLAAMNEERRRLYPDAPGLPENNGSKKLNGGAKKTSRPIRRPGKARKASSTPTSQISLAVSHLPGIAFPQYLRETCFKSSWIWLRTKTTGCQ
jgi:hypothetical protein